MNTKPNEEFLQCFDEQGNPTEGRPRSQVKTLPYQYWHGVCNIFVVNNAGQILCSKRSPLIENPGKWQPYFGGHVSAGLSFTQTAIKELQEESGIIITEPDLFLLENATYPDQKKFFRTFVILYNEPTINLAGTDGEITEYKWMNMKEYLKESEANPDGWCGSCKPERQKLIREWLATKIK